MARWKHLHRSWNVVLAIVLLSPSVCSRPSSEITVDTISSSIISTTALPNTEKATENSSRIVTSTSTEQQSTLNSETNSSDGSRYVKSKTPVIGESIKVVANQLLQSSSNITPAAAIVEDTRIPPKLKNQVDKNKHKIKTRQENSEEKVENSHAGIAVPVTMEELETENKISGTASESSTSSEGISTWILLSNSPNADNDTIPTEATKAEEVPKKPKPGPSKTKNKRPQQNKPKRPIIASINKSDLIAGGSAINENVLNKIKDTVLSNVQKNANANRFTTSSTTTAVPSTVIASTTKEFTTKSPSTLGTKDATKILKKKNKIRQKVTTALPSTVDNSALLPMEPKEQEIELEISTPATTTKKPRRSTTNRKKNKTKKRKTSKPTVEKESENLETKNSNKTKVAKPSKKPSPITTQIYNYLSREVMPSVGVGIVGLAGLVGLASYFFYPFATPVRRTFEVDKKDDLYKHNAEEYASEGNGQPEEEMLGTVLAGMPSHSKQKLNPYVNQTPHKYHVKKEPEQNIRYRHVANPYDSSYNSHYPQQKTGIAHGAAYSEVDHIKYNTQYETKHVFRPENNQYTYNNDNTNSYTPYPVVEPIYAAPQTGPSGISSYGSDTENTAYGIQANQDSNFKPVYSFEGQVFSETTSNSVTYPSTSLYLGSNTEAAPHQEFKYPENASSEVDNKFVVGNIPKELIDSATPAVVPEHGPRKLNRRKRSVVRIQRSIAGSIEETLKEKKDKDVFMSNDIDVSFAGIKKYDTSVIPITTPKANMNLALTEKYKENETKNSPDNGNNDIPVYTVYAKPSEVDTAQKTTSQPKESTIKSKGEIIESVSTLPLETHQAIKHTTETENFNEIDTTTKSFRIYEVFTSSSKSTDTETTYIDSQNLNDQTSANAHSTESTTQYKNANTETTTDSKTEFTSIFAPSVADIKETGQPGITSTTKKPKPSYFPEVITYPPYNQEGGLFTFLKRLIDFKYRLGLSILQTTSESLNRYLRNMSHSVKDVVKASQNGK